VLEQLDIHIQKVNLNPFSSTCTKINSKWIKNLKLQNY
jgi:hypothetical protein